MEKIKLTDNNLNKKQPSNLEAEQALLGSILVNNDILDEVSNTINPTSFYDPAHTKIYEVIETLNNKGMVPHLLKTPSHTNEMTAACTLLVYIGRGQLAFRVLGAAFLS